MADIEEKGSDGVAVPQEQQNKSRGKNRSQEPGRGQGEEQEGEAAESFVVKAIYPDAAQVFETKLKPLAEIKDKCCIVLDTNVLLDPYSTGDADLLEQCRRIYGDLVKKKRLVVPGQVAREFAKNRGKKLQELHSQLVRKKDKDRLKLPEIKTGKYPLLSSLEEYKKTLEIEEEIEKIKKQFAEKVQEYWGELNKVIERVQEWRWNDPVSELYQEVFNKETVLDPEINEAEIRRELERRIAQKIPPGYKDGGKAANPEGDLLIWHTILEAGKQRTEDEGVIFVSKDLKPDWWIRSEGGELYPRYELVYEFMRHTKGKALHIIKFSEFLKLFGASEAVVERVENEEVRQAEIKKFINNTTQLALSPEGDLQGITEADLAANISRTLDILKSHLSSIPSQNDMKSQAERAVFNWMQWEYIGSKVLITEGVVYPRFMVLFPNGITSGFEIILQKYRNAREVAAEIEYRYDNWLKIYDGKGVDTLVIIVIVDEEEDISKIRHELIRRRADDVESIAIFGIINNGRFERIEL
jgi:rRNA-processing protein FCF1